MILYIIVILLIVVVLYFIITYNNFRVLKNYVKEAFSTMDVYLKKRYDLVPNLVNVVKGYATHEKETLEAITNARTKAYDDMSASEKIKTSSEINSSISRLLVIAESYPELKANEEFQNLSKELVQLEDDIANARKYYNGTIKNLNNAVETFPSNLVAKALNITEESFFEASEEDKNSVKVEL